MTPLRVMLANRFATDFLRSMGVFTDTMAEIEDVQTIMVDCPELIDETSVKYVTEETPRFVLAVFTRDRVMYTHPTVTHISRNGSAPIRLEEVIIMNQEIPDSSFDG